MPLADHDPPALDPDPLEQALAVDERENLWRVARGALSEDVYAALWLRYVEDMSIEEIAQTLERSVSWTKVNLLRARKRLESVLLEPSTEVRHG